VNPLYIRVHERDNVAIIVNPEGLPAGTRFPCGLVLSQAIPEAHKVALRDLKKREAIIRYGEVIGMDRHFDFRCASVRR
jgi:galactarate dehydratase